MSFGTLITAMVTPMREDGSVDAAQAGRLAERLVASGTDTVLVSGTTGESPTLTDEEKLELFRSVVAAVGGRAKVMAGTGSYDTHHSAALTRQAEETGVDGILLVVPYYNKPPQEGLEHHFRTVAAATSLPVMVYNVPGRTGQNLLPDTVLRLAEVDNIAALKESTGNVDQATELCRRVPEDFAVYSGDDYMTLAMLALGAAGVVSVASHLVGRRIKEMMEAHVQGEVRRAARINQELFPLFRTLFITANPIPVKTAVNLTGFAAGPVRPPLTAMTAEQEQRLRQVMEDLNLI